MCSQCSPDLSPFQLLNAGSLPFADALPPYQYEKDPYLLALSLSPCMVSLPAGVRSVISGPAAAEALTWIAQYSCYFRYVPCYAMYCLKCVW